MKVLLFTIVAALLGACSSKADPVLLASDEALPYRTWLRTFHDGAYADQPFELFVRSKSAPTTFKMLSAAQCKNVSVVQTPDTLYVFYEGLILNFFDASDPSYADQPGLRLCALKFGDCAATKKMFSDSGRKPLNVCTYQTEDR